MTETCIVIQDYTPTHEDFIKGDKGDSYTIEKRETEPEWEGWLWCVDAQGNGGWVSESFLSIKGDEGILLGDYDATELTVKKGERLEVVSEVHGWLMCRSENKSGWVPKRNVEMNAPGTVL